MNWSATPHSPWIPSKQGNYQLNTRYTTGGSDTDMHITECSQLKHRGCIRTASRVRHLSWRTRDCSPSGPGPSLGWLDWSWVEVSSLQCKFVYQFNRSRSNLTCCQVWEIHGLDGHNGSSKKVSLKHSISNMLCTGQRRYIYTHIYICTYWI